LFISRVEGGFWPPRLLFAFALYGDHDKYTRGMIENCRLVAEHFPHSFVGIALGSDVRKEIVAQLEAMPHVRLKKLGFAGHPVMAQRMFLLEDEEIGSGCSAMFVRDADSRVHARDRACILEAWQSFAIGDCCAHTIRDHIYHRQAIMGGLFGIVKGVVPDLARRFEEFVSMHDTPADYGTDEAFLQSVVHPIVADKLLVHTDYMHHELDEPIVATCEFLEGKAGNTTNPPAPCPARPVPVPLENEFEFCGNVLDEHSTPCFSALDPAFIASFHELATKPDALLNILFRTFSTHLEEFLTRILTHYSPAARYGILRNMLTCVYMKDRERQLCESGLVFPFFRLFRHTHVDEDIILYSNRLIANGFEHGVVGISGRVSHADPVAPGTCVIVYGNMHDDYTNLPASNILYRHPVYVFSMQHTNFVAHSCFESISSIFVINLEERKDRFLEITVELSRIGAPLHRVRHYTARKDADVLSAYRGATKNHMDVLKLALDGSAQDWVLILEDDVTFSMDVEATHRDLETFLNHPNTPELSDICFLAASKYHEIQDPGPEVLRVIPHDLLRVSKQECTTSAAYLVHSSKLEKVLRVVTEGYEGMVDAHGRLDPSKVHTNCVDRYWAKRLDGMFIFKRKMAYQRPGFSSLTHTATCHFD
jgi:hypothetical protein